MVCIQSLPHHKLCSALIDTGSSINAISQATLKALYKDPPTLMPTSRLFKSISKDTIKPLGKLILPFQIENSKTAALFYVFNLLNHNFILDIPFMSQNRVLLDLAANTMDVTPRPINIYTNKHLDIPANTTTIVPGRLSSSQIIPSGLHGIISPAATEAGCQILPTASTSQADSVPIMIHNNTHVTSHIPQGTLIATFSPAHEDDILDQHQTPDSSTEPHLTSQSIKFNIDAKNGPQFQARLNNLLHKHQAGFMKRNDPLGTCKHSPLHIKLKPGAEPKHFSQYRYHPEVRKQMQQKIDEMLKLGIIEVSSHITWISPLVPVRKGTKKSRKHLQKSTNDFEIRPIIDLRGLNSACIYGKSSIPSVQSIIDIIAERKAVIYSVLDLKQGYFQIPLHKDSRPLCGFHFNNKGYRFKVCPMGIAQAPVHFTKMMATVLKDHVGVCATAYLDDILVFSDSKEQHLKDLDGVLTSITKSGLKLSTSKCVFATTSCDYLGHTITPTGIKPSSDHIHAITTFPTPTKTKELKSFLGICGYFATYIPKKGALVAPLLKLLKKDVKWQWTPECETNFQKLKTILASRPLLHYADHNKRFHLFTDSSGYAISGALMQEDNKGDLVPIAYCGRSLTDTEKKRDILEGEILAVCYSLTQFDYYLSFNQFTLYVDNNSLTKILSNEKRLSPKLARWVLLISSYDYTIQHIKGTKNVLADSLSRRQYDFQHTAADDKIDAFPLMPSDISAITRSQTKQQAIQQEVGNIVSDQIITTH